MHEEWTEARIDELGNGLRPVLKAGPFGSSVTKETYQPSGYKVYGQQEVVAKDLGAEAYFVSEATFSRHKSCAVKPGDLLMTMMGTIGRVYRVPEGAPEGIINPRLVRIAFDTSRILPEYAEVAFEQPPLQRLLNRRSHGGTMQGLNMEALASIRLLLPPIPEQRKIAEIMRTWDTAIHKTQQLIAAKERFLAVLRQRLFARKVRTGFARVKLDTILTEREELSDRQSPVYSVSVRKGLVNQIEHLGRSFSAAKTDHYNMVRPGDVVYTKSPTGEFPLGIVKQSRANQSAIVSPLYGVFVPRRREVGVLVDFFFESPINARNYLRPLVQKGAKNTLSIANDDFLRGEITLPTDSDLVERIAAFIDQARQELDLLEFRVQLLKKQKRGLMQKLLTGQWRLSLHGETGA